MSESTETSETTPTENPAPQASARKSLDDLPTEFSWVADELTRVRSEAAERRTKLREAEAQISELTEFRSKAEQAEEKSAETEISLARERAARKHRLDDEQFEFLSELTDPEAIDARAERLAALTKRKQPERPVDPTQGSTSGGGKKVTTADQFADFVGERLRS